MLVEPFCVLFDRLERARPSSRLLVAWAAYLIPPVYLDPRWAVAPLVVAVGLCTRFAVAYFKKHL